MRAVSGQIPQVSQDKRRKTNRISEMKIKPQNAIVASGPVSLPPSSSAFEQQESVIPAERLCVGTTYSVRSPRMSSSSRSSLYSKCYKRHPQHRLFFLTSSTYANGHRIFVGYFHLSPNLISFLPFSRHHLAFFYFLF